MTSSRRSLRVGSVVVLVLSLLTAGAVARADSGEGGTPVRADVERRIAAGDQHTCAVLDTGGVQCWGFNDNGQLGNGTRSTSTRPVVVQGLSAVTAVTAGTNHTCALVHGGTVRCWGLNGNGQLGDGSTVDRLVPVPVAGLTGVIAVAAGGFHTCAIVADGTVRCWGVDGMGQLGDGVPGDASSSAQPVPGITSANPARRLALGQFHTCALLQDGSVRCWGHNGFGQLGDGTTTDRSAPVAVTGLPDPADHPVVALAAGQGHTCALVDDGTVRCWGQNAYGQLGKSTTEVDGVMQPSLSPLTAQLAGGGDLVGADAVTAGQFHTCARLTSGKIRCWGQNGRAQLGADPKPLTPEFDNSTGAIEVAGLAGATGVTAGGYHTCAVVGTQLRCWGYDFAGQLGGYVASATTPVTVTSVSGAAGLSVGTDVACATVTTATPSLQCWGSNADGRLGNGSTVPDATIRVPVTGLSTLTSFDLGNGHACALPTGSGTPQCWGLGTSGQLGDGGSSSSNVPVTVSGVTAATSVSAGGALSGTEVGHSCARLADGTARCWGANGAGQLGDNSTVGRSTAAPVRYDSDPGDDVVVADLPDVVSVVAGGLHSCAVMSDTSVRCWGANGSGQVGDGTTAQRLLATRVQTDTDPDVDAPLTGVASLALGAAHTCALMTDRTVRCWGANGSGQLGDGSTTTRKIPVTVAGLDDVLLLTAGDAHTCAVKGDGSMVCWGANGSGQLGDGSTSASSSPVAAFAAPGVDEAKPLVLAIGAGRRTTCARLVDTTVRCWGDNAHGQLGDGIDQRSLVPVTVGLLPAVAGNHIPDPQDDTATTTPDTAVVLDVLANDSDEDSDPLTVVDVSDPAHGIATGSGPLGYQPDAGYCGSDTFTYTVSDGTAEVPATVTVTMNCGPVALDDTASTPEDTPVTVAVLSNDTDPDSDPLQITSVTSPAHGAVTITGGGTTLRYAPAPDYCATTPDVLTYTVDDGNGHTASAALSVVVTCVQDAPVATTDLVGTSEGQAVLIPVLANDIDVDGDTLMLVGVATAAHGTATQSGSSVLYTPAAGWCGSDSFTYTASDGGRTAVGTVGVTVTCVDDSPVVGNDRATTPEDTSVVVDVLSNDVDPEGAPLTVTAVGDPPHGTAAVGAGGTTVTYSPDPDWCGTDSFTYVASDGALGTTGTATVTVTCTNDAPVAVDDPATVAEDSSVHVHAAANDVDVDGDDLAVTAVTSAPAHGTAVVESPSSILYTPARDFCGDDAFAYRVADPAGASDIGHVAVTVACVNDPPVIASVAGQSTRWNDALVVLLSATDADVSDPSTFSLVSGPAGVTVTPAGALAWTPSAAQVGTSTITVRVSDGTAASQTSFSVTVTRRPTTIQYTGATSGQFSDPAQVRAVLTDAVTSSPVASRTVAFTVGTASAGATTGTDGVATAGATLASVGTTTATAAFAGDSAWTSSSASAPFTVTKELATTTYSGQRLVLTSGTSAPVALAAVVAEEPDGTLGGSLGTATVTFRNAVGGAVLCSAPVTTSAPGTGTATCTTSALGLGSRPVLATLTSAGYSGLSDVVVATVAAPGRGDAAGAGAVGADRFGFLAKAAKKGAPTGDVVHVFLSGSTATVVRATSLTSLVTACGSGSPRTCTATVRTSSASTIVVDLVTGAITTPLGTSSIAVDATDAAEPVGGSVPPDRYAVAVSGSVSRVVGTPTGQLLITAGNVRVPS